MVYPTVSGMELKKSEEKRPYNTKETEEEQEGGGTGGQFKRAPKCLGWRIFHKIGVVK